MRRRWTHLSAVAVALLSGVLLAPPADAAAPPVRLVVPPDIGDLPGVRKVEDVVSFRIVNKDLLVATSLPPTSGTKRLAVEGFSGATRASDTSTSLLATHGLGRLAVFARFSRQRNKATSRPSAT